MPWFETCVVRLLGVKTDAHGQQISTHIDTKADYDAWELEVAKGTGATYTFTAKKGTEFTDYKQISDSNYIELFSDAVHDLWRDFTKGKVYTEDQTLQNEDALYKMMSAYLPFDVSEAPSRGRHEVGDEMVFDRDRPKAILMGEMNAPAVPGKKKKRDLYDTVNFIDSLGMTDTELLSLLTYSTENGKLVPSALLRSYGEESSIIDEENFAKFAAATQVLLKMKAQMRRGVIEPTEADPSLMGLTRYHSYGETIENFIRIGHEETEIKNGNAVMSQGFQRALGFLFGKSIFGDEAQDFSGAHHEVLKLATGNDESKISLYGDTNQAIYTFVAGSPHNLESAALSAGEIKDGNGNVVDHDALTVLTKNYRNSPEMIEFLQALTKIRYKHADGTLIPVLPEIKIEPGTDPVTGANAVASKKPMVPHLSEMMVDELLTRLYPSSQRKDGKFDARVVRSFTRDIGKFLAANIAAREVHGSRASKPGEYLRFDDLSEGSEVSLYNDMPADWSDPDKYQAEKGLIEYFNRYNPSNHERKAGDIMMETQSYQDAAQMTEMLMKRKVLTATYFSSSKLIEIKGMVDFARSLFAEDKVSPEGAVVRVRPNDVELHEKLLSIIKDDNAIENILNQGNVATYLFGDKTPTDKIEAARKIFTEMLTSVKNVTNPYLEIPPWCV